MKDIVLVTADSVRYDFIDSMDFVSTHTVRRGIAGSHYTRPSLAGLLSSNFRSVIESRITGETLASVLSANGYTCIGLSGSPHTDPQFGFDTGFDYRYTNFSDAGNRGRESRQFFSQFDVIRRIYHRIHPPEAKLDNRPSNEHVINEAIKTFTNAPRPRFMWLHLMGTHRPYGLGAEAVPSKIDRKALFSPARLSEKEHKLIKKKYREALSRADTQIERLLTQLDTDPLFVFTSDHGDEFGEDGQYFHQPQRRRVTDELISVPVVMAGIDFESNRLSLLDLGPTLVSYVGCEIPKTWNGNDLLEERTTTTLTIAPWHNKATVCWQDHEAGTKVVCRGSTVTLNDREEQLTLSRANIPENIQSQLRDLGYRS